MIEEDYSQLFCIIGSKGEFWHGYEARRYLPPLEPLPFFSDEPEKPTMNITIPDNAHYILQRLNEIEEKLNTHIEASKGKKKGRYKEYI